MSKIMMWHVWKVTYLCRNVTIVCGASYHWLGSWISWDLMIQFWLQVKSYISDWQFSKLQHLASYVSCHNAMAYDRAIQGQGPHKCEQRDSPAPAIPFRIICNRSISTILDLSVSASSDAKSINDQNPLDILTYQAVQMIEHTNQAQVVDGMQLTLPNWCSYEGCGPPLHLVPEHCSTCFRLVHLIIT